ncbi:calaxin-like [Mytilus californianus]|uniref:EF-hand calcium-binding domain-containing protein 1 n=1 Tax=Mytilus coruscus TaxID=42192 RepID=A0A6J8DWA7_MYTCO|nr:calaxin-like [Mytilus californianus]CAC5411574.1 EF-hand calcium-binding domain-containing protein 1 [Mytilus coruscus]
MSHHNSKRQEQTKLIEKLTKKHTCNFKKHEIEKLIYMYQELVKNSPPSYKIDRSKFRDLLHQHFEMTDDILLDRVFRAFDQDSDNYISQEEWVTGLSTFIDQSEPESVIKFCFMVYDLNGDGYISREEMFQLLKYSLVKQTHDEDSDESIKELVELILKKLDRDHDGRVSLLDFTTSVKEEPLLIEAFGTCLPSQKMRDCFRTLICEGQAKKL